MLINLSQKSIGGEFVNYIIMERVKDISKLKLGVGWVLMKIHVKSTLIVTPENNGSNNVNVDYAEVIAVATDIKDLEVGDIILDFHNTKGFEYKGDQYALIPRMSIKIAVAVDNFLHKKKVKPENN
jgi:archaellum component FlaF (FlaF/FlaG flagellin family)